ncbi:MAG: sensor histidine kinase, partial [Desulfatiglandales bacterium]
DKSLVILPFVTLKNTYGMAMLISPTEWDKITYEIMTLFSFLSRQVALLLENIEVYNELAREHQALQDAQERIMFAEKMASVGRLASRASHEILNPLNVILGNAQLIAAKDKGGSPYSKYAQRIIEQGLRIEAIVKSLVKAYDLGNVPKRAVSVSGLLGRVFRVVKGEAEKANVEIEMDVPDSGLFIWGSEIALLEAFVSLIKNSFEAMAGGGKVFVSVTPNEESETVIITLRDTGPGIPEDVSDKLFEPFFTTKNGKLGMGLFMVYNVLEEHSGKIEITSEPGQGTKITIILPLFREER